MPTGRPKGANKGAESPHVPPWRPRVLSAQTPHVHVCSFERIDLCAEPVSVLVVVRVLSIRAPCDSPVLVGHCVSLGSSRSWLCRVCFQQYPVSFCSNKARNSVKRPPGARYSPMTLVDLCQGGRGQGFEIANTIVKNRYRSDPFSEARRRDARRTACVRWTVASHLLGGSMTYILCKLCLCRRHITVWTVPPSDQGRSVTDRRSSLSPALVRRC